MNRVIPNFRSWPLWARLLLVAGAALLQVLVALLLIPVLGDGVIALALLPLLVIGLCFGLRWGPVVGLLLFLESVLLLLLAGQVDVIRWFLGSGWIWLPILVLTGAMIGWLSDVRAWLWRERVGREQAEVALEEQARALKKERERAQQYLDVASTMIVEVGPDGKVVLVNKRGCEILGCEETDVVGRNWVESFIPERRRKEVKAVFDRLAAGERGSAEWVMDVVLTGDGMERLMLWRNAVLTDEAGEVVGILRSGEDITERERAKEGQSRTMAEALQAVRAQRESEERYRGLFQGMPVGLYRLAPGGDFLEVNPALVQMLGYPDREALVETNIADRYVETDAYQAWLTLLEQAEHISGHEVQWRRHDGTPIWVQESTHVVRDEEGGVRHYEGAVEDISERKQAEAEREQLLAAEREQRLMAEAVMEVTEALTTQVNYKAVMDEILVQVQRIVPYTAANIALVEGETLRAIRWRGYEDFGVEALAANLTAPLADFPLDAEVVRTRQPVAVTDVRQESRWAVRQGMDWIRSHLTVPICLGDRVVGLLRLDGDAPDRFVAGDAQRLQLLAGTAAIAIQNAQLVEGLGADLVARMVDVITERGKSEATLRSVGDAILVSDLQGQVEYVNDACKDLVGYPSAEIVGQPFDSMFEESDLILRARQAALAHGEIWRGRASLRRKDGDPRAIVATIAPVRDEEGRTLGCVASCWDVGGAG